MPPTKTNLINNFGKSRERDRQRPIATRKDQPSFSAFLVSTLAMRGISL